MWGIVEPLRAILKAVLSMPNTSTQHNSNYVVFSDSGKACYISPVGKYSLQGTTQGRYLTGGVPPVRFSM